MSSQPRPRHQTVAAACGLGVQTVTAACGLDGECLVLIVCCGGVRANDCSIALA